MKWISLLALAAPAQAYIRFGCATLTTQRLDPVVEVCNGDDMLYFKSPVDETQPGKLPSSHVHQVVGGNAFNATMTGDIGEKATCTTCSFSEDFSNYWVSDLNRRWLFWAYV